MTMTIGYDRPLYGLPFDHRATFSKNMFGWQEPLSPEQTAEIAASYREWVGLFEKAK
jgi:5-dehydro-2-deoxygluconokinase